MLLITESRRASTDLDFQKAVVKVANLEQKSYTGPERRTSELRDTCRSHLRSNLRPGSLQRWPCSCSWWLQWLLGQWPQGQGAMTWLSPVGKADLEQLFDFSYLFNTKKLFSLIWGLCRANPFRIKLAFLSGRLGNGTGHVTTDAVLREQHASS